MKRTLRRLRHARIKSANDSSREPTTKNARCNVHRASKRLLAVFKSKPFEERRREIAFGKGGDDQDDVLAGEFRARADFASRGDGGA